MSHFLVFVLDQLHKVFNAVMTIAFYEIIKNHLRKRDEAKTKR